MMFNSFAKLVEPAKLLIIVGIAYTLATTGLYFIAPARSSVPLGDASPTSTSVAQGLSVEEIVKLHLFGTPTGAPVATEADNYAAPETRLQLELLGVFQAQQAEQSAAIVAERNKQGLLYQIGEKMPGNAVLAEVYVDRIVIRRGGVYETLRFSEESPLLTSSPSTSQSSGETDFFSNNPVSAASGDQSNAYAQPGSASGNRSNSTDIRQLIADYREKLEEDPQQALASAGLTAVAPGESQGYRLGNLANSPQLSRTGLQPNDVILSVNGQPVGNVQQDQSQLDNVLAQDTARLEVQRGSRRFFVTAKL